jgi:phospholipid transport system substrate-binding protein
MSTLLVKGKLILALVLSLVVATVAANEPEDPQHLVKQASDRMIQKLSDNKQQIRDNEKVVMDIVEEILIPLFATNTISRKVLGVHARMASDEQKEQFAQAFKDYMIRFYAKAFAAYNDQEIKFEDTPEFEDKTRVTVKTKLIQPGGQPIPIDYRMQRSGDSWKVIDVKIEGISLVISNKSQFGSQISRDGLDTVIAKLMYKNEQAKSDG